MRSICHQTMFVKKELHNKYGLYDITEKNAMDYDFLCRITDEPFAFINETLVNFAPAGNSSENYFKCLHDSKRIYIKYNGKSFMLWLWQMRLSLLYTLMKSPVGKFLFKIKVLLKLENL